MSKRQQTVERLCEKGIVAVVRAPSSEALKEVAEALLAGGVDCIEITMTTPNATTVISDCRKTFGDRANIGAGSVLDTRMAQEVIDAGAQYLISPIFNPEIIALGHTVDLPVVAGALTPTEILNATHVGADLVKVFPGGQFGPAYFKDVLAPMPHLKLTPTGGVDLTTAAEWIRAGAVTLGVGSALVTKKALAERNFAEIERLAREFVRIVAEARAARK